MTVQLIGAALLARLMDDGRPPAPDLSWLLFGPEDDRVVDPAPEPTPTRRIWPAE